MKESLLKCILIDDETEAMDTLEYLLINTGLADVIEKITTPKTAILRIKELQPDIVFLDIDMPEKNGLELLEDINNEEINVKVVFATAFNQYVLEALRNSAFDYLEKPVDRIELKNVLKRASQNKNQTIEQNKALYNQFTDIQLLKLPVSFGFIFIKFNEIVYLEADSNYSKIFLKNGKCEISSKNLGQIEELLNNKMFIRISRSNIININFLSKFNRGKKECILYNNENNYNLKVTKNYIENLENIFN